MDSWNRLGAGAGLAGVVCYLVGAFLPGSPLKPDAATDSIVSHLADHRRSVLIGYALTLMGLALLVWFLGYLRAVLAEAEAEHGSSGSPLATVTTVSWVLLFAIAGAGGAGVSVVAWRGAGQVDPNLVRLVFDISNLSLYTITATVAFLSVAAPTVVIARTGVLPRWLVVIGVIELAVNVVELAGIGTRTGWNAGGYVAGVGPLVWMVWVAALSITMLLRKPATVAAGTGAATATPAEPVPNLR